MSIEFTSRVLPAYIRLDCTGVYSQGDALQVFTQAFALAALHGRDAALIDARGIAPPEPSLMQRFDMAVHVAEMQQRQVPRIRLAVIGNEPLVHPQRFAEVVATNRGANVRVFTDEPQAIGWLIQKPKSS